MRTVQINRDILNTKDASEYRKDFYSTIVGQTFSLCGIKTLDVPDEVAAEWTGADAEVEIINYS